MNINYIQGKVILIVLACVLHANYGETSNSKSKKPSPIFPSSSKNKNNEVSLKDPNNDSIEQMILKIAIIIQGCIDKKTMNNKKFKIKLDNLYKNTVKKTINEEINKHMVEVNKIKKQYEEDVKLLKIINPEGAKKKTSKNKPDSKSESSKKSG